MLPPLSDANSIYRIDKHLQRRKLPWTLKLKANFIPERLSHAGQKSFAE